MMHIKKGQENNMWSQKEEAQVRQFFWQKNLVLIFKNKQSLQKSYLRVAQPVVNYDLSPQQQQQQWNWKN